MAAVRDGDASKAGILFDRYHARLFDFFCRMNGNRAESEDLVQDVFSRILQYRKTFRDDSPFLSWMYQIARNARLQYFKKYGEPVVAGTQHHIPDRQAIPGMQLERNEQAAAIQRCLMKLADDRRELLVLVWYQEMKYDQIAVLLETQVGTVKVRVHRAMKELREIYLNECSGKTLCNVKKSEATLRII